MFCDGGYARCQPFHLTVWLHYTRLVQNSLWDKQGSYLWIGKVIGYIAYESYPPCF